MVDISGIINKYKKEKEKADAKEAAASVEAQGLKSVGEIVVSQKTEKPNPESEATYNEALGRARHIYRARTDQEPEIFTGLEQILEKFISELLSEKKDLLRLAITGYSKNESYLYAHAVNVCIIALEIGIGLHYEHYRLAELGIGAFLHDIGIIKYFDIINKPELLNTQERLMINNHPTAGIEMLKKWDPKAGAAVLGIIEQEHERIDGSGYPNSLKGGAISEYAQIVGLVDVYEAMMHQRPYRDRFNSLETMKHILNNKELFEAGLVKALLQRMGIFPRGSLVQLNTKEVGVVIGVNLNSPMCPIVSVHLDAAGKELPQPKHINLADNRGVIYVEECVKL